MAFGTRVWDAAGTLQLDSTDNAGRYLGQVTTGTSNGSATVSGWSDQGAPFFEIVPLAYQFSSLVPPIVTRSGNTLSWSFESGILSGNRMSVTIMYGVK